MADELNLNQDAPLYNGVEDSSANSYSVTHQETGPLEAATDDSQEGLIAGKFKSHAELEKAYLELQQKLGAPQKQEEPNTEADDGQPKKAAIEHTAEAESMLQEKGLSLDEFTHEFERSGALSEASYGKLEAGGISRDMVNAYIEGQRVLVTAQIEDIQNAVGGPETYSKMAEWARTALSAEEKAAYDQVLMSNRPGVIKLAAQGLKSRYEAAMGKDPVRVINGATNNNADGLSRFRSQAEVTRAMRDERYKSDPAYRRDVETKLLRSNF